MQRVFGDLDALRFVDNRLDDERRAAFAAHLADDASDAERVATWQRQNDALRAAFASVAAEPVPVWLRLGNMAGERPAPEPAPEPPLSVEPIRVAPVRPAAAPRPSLRTTSLGIGAALLVGAGVMVLVATRSLLPPLATPEETRAQSVGALSHAFEARAVDAYRTFALDPTHPVEIASTQQAQLERWLQHRLSVPVHAPDLRGQGWTLLGGRLAPGDVGPAAFFVYQDEANGRMGLYMARTGAPPEANATIGPMPGGSTLSWVVGPVGFVVALNKDADWLRRNAEPLKAGVMHATAD